jgi:hypothetical protein
MNEIGHQIRMNKRHGSSLLGVRECYGKDAEWVSRQGRNERNEELPTALILPAGSIQQIPKKPPFFPPQFHRALLFDPPLATFAPVA